MPSAPADANVSEAVNGEGSVAIEDSEVAGAANQASPSAPVSDVASSSKPAN